MGDAGRFRAADGERGPADGAAGLRVLSVLEAVSASLAARGKPVSPEQPAMMLDGSLA